MTKMEAQKRHRTSTEQLARVPMQQRAIVMVVHQNSKDRAAARWSSQPGSWLPYNSQSQSRRSTPGTAHARTRDTVTMVHNASRGMRHVLNGLMPRTTHLKSRSSPWPAPSEALPERRGCKHRRLLGHQPASKGGSPGGSKQRL